MILSHSLKWGKQATYFFREKGNFSRTHETSGHRASNKIPGHQARRSEFSHKVVKLPMALCFPGQRKWMGRPAEPRRSPVLAQWEWCVAVGEQRGLCSLLHSCPPARRAACRHDAFPSAEQVTVLSGDCGLATSYSLVNCSARESSPMHVSISIPTGITSGPGNAPPSCTVSGGINVSI